MLLTLYYQLPCLDVRKGPYPSALGFALEHSVRDFLNTWNPSRSLCFRVPFQRTSFIGFLNCGYGFLWVSLFLFCFILFYFSFGRLQAFGEVFMMPYWWHGEVTDDFSCGLFLLVRKQWFGVC